MRWSSAAGWLAVGCAGPEAASFAPPVLLAPPEVVQPAEEAPLVRRVNLSFDRVVTLSGRATDGRHEIEVRTEPSPSPSFPLIGLYTDATWIVDLIATDGWGQRLTLDPITFTTVGLPEPWPHVDLLASEPEAEPGFTLVPLMQGDSPAYLTVLDARGEVAWVWVSAIKWLEATVGDDGRIRAGAGETKLIELDWEGVSHRLLVASSAASVGAAGLEMPEVPITHHDLVVEPDGAWVTLTRESIEVADFPLSYTDPADRGPATLRSDVVVRIDPDTGAVLDRWPLAPALDPDRIGWDSLNPSPTGLDWTHTNSVQPIEEADQWLISVKHQDAVVAMDRSTGRLDWILGNPAGWDGEPASKRLEPRGEPFEWPWHQHAAKWLGDGGVLLFDNGNHGAAPLTGDPKRPLAEIRSRVVEYRVDPVARTVSQAWSYTPEDPHLFSTAMGDVDLLPGGTVLADFAYLQMVDGASVLALGWGGSAAQLHEFEPATGRLVWGVAIWQEGIPWRSYRAERFASFGEGGVAP